MGEEGLELSFIKNDVIFIIFDETLISFDESPLCCFPYAKNTI